MSNRASSRQEIQDRALKILESIQPETTRFLRELVDLNSFTGNPAGVRANAYRIVRQFAPFGFTPAFVQCEMPGTGEHLFLESAGAGPTILLVSHLDTVFPAEEQETAYAGWKEEGPIAIGPGTVDIKGGTAMMWMTLRAFFELDPELFGRVHWVLAFNAAEECLNHHFAEVCVPRIAGREAYGFVFESDNKSDAGMEILSHRNGQVKCHLSVRGRGAHSAGVGCKNGINAITQLASIIGRISALTDHDKFITANVGIIRGGQSTNRVPDLAEAWFEVRFQDSAHYDAIKEFLLRLNGPGEIAAVSDGVRSEVTLTIEEEIAPWLPTEESLRLAGYWTQAAAQCGHTLTVSRRGGLSDANFLGSHLPMLDGLGPRGGNAHGIARTAEGSRITEFVDLGSFVPKALVNTLALMDLAGK